MRKVLSFLLVFLLATPAKAIVVSRITTFEAGTPIEADDMNAELDNILSAINGNLASDNILAGGIATSDIATASVTPPKMGPLGEQISSSSSYVERSSSVESAIPNMTANLTTYGKRPVWVGLMSEGGVSAPGRVTYRHTGGGATDNSAYISFRRDFATVNQSGIGVRSITNSTENMYVSYPCSTFWFIETAPSSGPHNYTAYYRVASFDSGIIAVENCKLVTFEL